MVLQSIKINIVINKNELINKIKSAGVFKGYPFIWRLRECDIINYFTLKNDIIKDNKSLYLIYNEIKKKDLRDERYDMFIRDMNWLVFKRVRATEIIIPRDNKNNFMIPKLNEVL